MSYQEKKALLNFVTYVIALLLYANYVHAHYWQEGMNTDELLQFWSRFLLIMIPVQIVIHIIVHILLGIARGMANGGKIKEEVVDEFDKIIELKSSRNGMISFAFTFIGGLIWLANGYGVNHFFMTLIIGGVFGEVIEAVSRVYYYRKGV
ncbi:hypothetical protein [Phaeocystidibacter luteus]|uniref:Uncharacterized protein n=1 Tax=Phaeocystidibacter luteus TaxID=911197 RepID=A0A6N6RMD4_9FLAO|nr:hypothetical protein [Phaeocystidibacter luteus]KAB2814740.1 hypothetical protein F8C67_03065 [Phaeocystidibacter luteus]